jgi:large subunit ribosomal protein L1
MAEAKQPSTKTSRKAAKSGEALAKTEAKKPVTKKTEDLKVVKKTEKSAVKKNSEKLKKIVGTEDTAEEIVEQEKGLDKEEAKITKAGKHSVKSLKEAEEKAAKEERKAKGEEPKEAQKPKPVKTRSLLERRGKKFREAAKLIDRSKEYSVKDALELAVKTSPVKFDATVELHVRLGVDPKQSDQYVRGNLVLPAGTGKTSKVAVFADSADVTKAKEAGADIAGSDEFLQQLDKENINFDVLIATPAMMPKLGKYARLLGPKGLMPSPKSGTVTTDVAKAVKEAKGGKVEYRVDSTGIAHIAIGKVSFGGDKLAKNATAVFASIKAAKPASLKSNYILSIFVTTTMGPSAKIAVSEI